jgi:uncharacterized membrane protein
VDFLALMIASLTTFALTGAAAGAMLGYLLWGWMGAVVGLIGGYAMGVWYASRYGGVPISSSLQGWLSILLFLAGLTVLAIVTR